MAAWRTFDESTAKELRKHVWDGEIEALQSPGLLFQEQSSIVVVPSAKKGVALVITGRRRAAHAIEAPSVVEPQAVAKEDSEFQIAPETWDAPAFDLASEAPPAESESPFSQTDSSELKATVEPEIVERCAEEPLIEVPKIPEFEETAPAESAPGPQIEEAPEAEREDHYVATGFLGLVDRVEDEEEAEREKRPWWKRIFSD